jgi:hypothetical protein
VTRSSYASVLAEDSHVSPTFDVFFAHFSRLHCTAPVFYTIACFWGTQLFTFA